MKSLKYLLILLSLISISAFASGDMKMPKNVKKLYKINTKTSKITWLGKKVTGKHVGTIAVKSGTLNYNGTDLTGGEIVIDMTTINTTDLSGEWKIKLDNHLNSDDFFSTKKHKTAKLVIKDAQFGKGGQWDVMADLTIKGITKPVMFKADVSKKGKNLMAKATVVFNRLDYGVKYNSGKFFKNLGDKMINDKVELTVNISAQ